MGILFRQSRVPFREVKQHERWFWVDIRYLIAHYSVVMACYSAPTPVTPIAQPLLPFTEASLDPRLSCKPPLKWAGGKRWQLKYLLPLWRIYDSRRLVEPFCGGLAVALGLAPRRALLNDINPHLINFYKWLKRGLTLPFEPENDEQFYYACRSRFNELLRRRQHKTEEAAALFYYLNRTGYNGLCRFNRSGFFNVPFGTYSRIHYRNDFSEYRAILKRWVFKDVPFHHLQLRPDDFVYADPPYDVEFTTYSKGGFSWSDQERAAEWLARHPGPVVLSNQATERILQLYKRLGYRAQLVTAPRRISCNGDRTPAPEVIATRNIPL
jgi:DNA adenine methylase